LIKKLELEEISPIKNETKKDGLYGTLFDPNHAEMKRTEVEKNISVIKLNSPSVKFKPQEKPDKTIFCTCPKCKMTIEIDARSKFVRCITPFCMDINIHFCIECNQVVSLAEKDNHYLDKGLLYCKQIQNKMNKY
jgi:hypothetical protein